MPINLPPEFKIKEKKSADLKVSLLKTAEKFTDKLPSKNTIKKVATGALEVTKEGLKDGVKKSATKVAGIGVTTATASAIGGVVLTGGAVATALTVGIPLVAGVTATCILDRAVKAIMEENNSDDDNHIDTN